MPKRRVLAIRPEPALTAALACGVDALSREMTFCQGNVDALQLLRIRPFDVVVTDPTTAIDEDLALATEILAVRPTVRIIVLAPSAESGDVIDAIRSHVFACFTAPFDYTEITAMVATALELDSWRDGIQVISGLDRWLTLRVSCHLLSADRLVRFMTELQPADGSHDRDLLISAFREMLLNAMEHGAGFDADKVIEVTAARTGRAIVYHFRDPGNGFDRDDLEHATTAPDPETVVQAAIARAAMGLRPGGFGMLIARQIADELVYNEPGNEVLLIKYLK